LVNQARLFPIAAAQVLRYLKHCIQGLITLDHFQKPCGIGGLGPMHPKETRGESPALLEKTDRNRRSIASDRRRLFQNIFEFVEDALLHPEIFEDALNYKPAFGKVGEPVCFLEAVRALIPK